MRKIDIHGIRFNTWWYFILFSVSILLLLWLMQIVFLGSFYEWIKTGNIRRAATEITTLYDTVQGQALNARLIILANDYDIFINITNRNGDSLYAAGPFGRDYRTPAESIRNSMGRQDVMLQGGFALAAQKILEQQNGRWSHVFSDQQGRRMLLFGEQMRTEGDATTLLMLTAPLRPLTDTVRILKKQFLIITLSLLVLALPASAFVSLRLSRPLSRITEKARRFSAGDYDQVFEYGKYTEVNQLADALNHLGSALTQVERLRSELIGNVSHELRTPLTMIRVYAEMIRDLNGEDRKKREDNLEVIIEESDRLSSLVQDLLDLSLAQAGATPYYPETFDLTDMVCKILTRYTALTAKEGYSFAFSQTEAAWVQGEPKRIEQVIYNLINNAVNHAGEEKNIHISLRDCQDAIRVSVTDTGRGIVPEYMDKIWDRYFREEHTHLVMGTGLGLAIVKSILERHGACYGVQSVVGQGSTFWFELKKSEKQA